MEIREVVDEIIDRVYHGAVLSDEPDVQERIVHSDVWNLIEQYTNELDDDRIAELVEEVQELERMNRDLRDQLEEAEAA